MTLMRHMQQKEALSLQRKDAHTVSQRDAICCDTRSLLYQRVIWRTATHSCRTFCPYSILLIVAYSMLSANFKLADDNIEPPFRGVHFRIDRCDDISSQSHCDYAFK
jgi:hypothetical protein